MEQKFNFLIWTSANKQEATYISLYDNAAAWLKSPCNKTKEI